MDIKPKSVHFDTYVIQTSTYCGYKWILPLCFIRKFQLCSNFTFIVFKVHDYGI